MELDCRLSPDKKAASAQLHTWEEGTIGGKHIAHGEDATSLYWLRPVSAEMALLSYLILSISLREKHIKVAVAFAPQSPMINNAA